MSTDLRNSAVPLEEANLRTREQKDTAKECSNYREIALISRAGDLMLKNLQARLHQYVNRELSGVQAGFRKGR